jgi:hypothetical protein
MHILFLTDNFPPEGNAPATRTYEHAREWVKAGHRVTVITCAPNFPEGKVYPGYENKLFQMENMDGIEVRRVKTYITANEGFARRSLDYLSFIFSAIIAGLFVRKPNVIVATSPQFFCACGGSSYLFFGGNLLFLNCVTSGRHPFRQLERQKIQDCSECWKRLSYFCIGDPI